MAHTFYEDLGIKPGATKAEIKSAYRHLVLLHHPDRSSDPKSKEIFLKAKEANEVLSNPEARARYDEQLGQVARRQREEAERKAVAAKREVEKARQAEERKHIPSGATVAEEIVRLQMLFGSGRHSEAENLAHAILQVDPRQAIPYAVLADILRGRGYVNEAGKMYAYAAQMDPRNPVYQRKYEALLRSSRIVTQHGDYRMEAEDKRVLAPMVGGGFTVAAGLYVWLSPESSVMSRFPFVSSWTAGVMVMLFVCGVAIGAAMSVGNLLDRFEAISNSSGGRASPTAILGLVAIVNFWVSAIFYVLIAVGLRAFNVSTTRLMIGVAAVTLVLTLASFPSTAIRPSETFLWGGNLVYVGGLVGWMAADALRTA